MKIMQNKLSAYIEIKLEINNREPKNHKGLGD